ncbi:MAG TPA: class I SAM-dependent methyltransferase [Gaiellaceae bacterium]|nr:class I SAM-dependent methyltransferase [Gaiellaceae bacterium]
MVLRSRVDGAGDLRGSWEANAADFIAWARAPGHDSYWRFHRDQFLELVPAPGRLTVDLGCGEGRLSRDLKALRHRVVGVDASGTMVAAAREADPEIEVHCADAAALPLADGCADLVVAFMSLQDVDDPAPSCARRRGCSSPAAVSAWRSSTRSTRPAGSTATPPTARS